MNKNVGNEVLNFGTSPGKEIEIDLGIDGPVFVSGNENSTFSLVGQKFQYFPNNGFSGSETLTLAFPENKDQHFITIKINVGYSFKAKSHILSLLGNELIGNDNLAIFELIKNSYDADAEEVKIVFNNLNTENQSLYIEDDGFGMSLNVLQDVWLEIGTDFKRGKKREPSPKYNRISLGEKGVGRLAVHKLGKEFILETQSKGTNESYRLSFNWEKLVKENEYINEAIVQIETIPKSLFDKNQGTRIIVSDLNKKVWTKKDVRDLAKKIENIKSPFNQIPNFHVEITANDEHREWLKGIKTSDEILKNCLYYFEFDLKKFSKSKYNNFEDLEDRDNFVNFFWKYKFSPPPLFGIKESFAEIKNDTIENVFFVGDLSQYRETDKSNKILRNSDLNGIGNISGRFFVYNQANTILNNYGQANAIKSYVKENSGIRIYRDNIRVYNYGEPGDDWLGLDLLKIQRTGDHFGKKVTIGGIELTLAGSENGLKEKTNREGFDENICYERFRAICREIFKFFENTSEKDRKAIDAYLLKISPIKKIGFSETIDDLEKKMRALNLEQELLPLIRRVQKDYNEMRDVMVNSGMTGLNLGIVFHEVDREMKFINSDLNSMDVDITVVKNRVKNLIQILESFSPILRQNKSVNVKASEIVEKAKRINLNRFSFHKVIFSSPLVSGENEDFIINGPANLLISAISNLIDNSIYWSTSKRDLLGKDFKAGLYIGTDLNSFDGPAIIVADNGLGFNIEPEDMLMPFRTTKPGGMGIGLYFVNMVMNMIGGKLIFADKEDLDIPKVYDGACIILIFPKLRN